jgi:hypothetical protein
MTSLSAISSVRDTRTSWNITPLPAPLSASLGQPSRFPWEPALDPMGNFYVANSDTDTVLRLNGTTGAFMSTFASSVDNAAGLAFGPANNLFVVNSSSPGAVTELNATNGALINTITAGGLFPIPKGLPLVLIRTFTSPTPMPTTSSSSTEPPALSSVNL